MHIVVAPDSCKGSVPATGVAEAVRDAAFVVSGEGRTDFQTARGKAPVGVARAAKAGGIPVFCLSGSLGPGAHEVLAHGIDAVMSICDRPLTLEECMRDGPALIEAGAERLCRIVAASRSIGHAATEG
jgi:glycerate kinase